MDDYSEQLKKNLNTITSIWIKFRALHVFGSKKNEKGQFVQNCTNFLQNRDIFLQISRFFFFIKIIKFVVFVFKVYKYEYLF